MIGKDCTKKNNQTTHKETEATKYSFYGKKICEAVAFKNLMSLTPGMHKNVMPSPAGRP